MGLPFPEGLKEILFQDSHINGSFLGTHYVAPREKKENINKRGYSLKVDIFACLNRSGMLLRRAAKKVRKQPCYTSTAVWRTISTQQSFIARWAQS
jgi:hypothetical protein